MTIRFKLTMGAIAAILAANSLLVLANVRYFQQTWQEDLQTRVRLDLNSARTAYNNHVELVARSLATASLDRSLAAALAEGRLKDYATWAKRFYKAKGMDFFLLLDPQGKTLYRAQYSQQSGDDLAGNPLVAEAIQKKRSSSGSILLSARELQNEGPELVERAQFSLPNTSSTKRVPEKAPLKGMCLAAAVPLLGDQGQILGILYGGNLLNRRYELVDSIKKDVFAAGLHEGREIGTVTIFLGDLRIATNVVGEDGRRAVGTRMSEAVAAAVLGRGETWDAPAQVINDWYFTAYEPIRDPRRQIIGALYVGLLQAPFADAWSTVIWRFVILTGVATAISLVLVFLLTFFMMQPIERIVAMARKIAAGDLTARVGIRPSGEMGILCTAVDGMADAVTERETQLKMAVRQQVSRAEKLASIGRLAAGVAHEINNPLTGVLTFAHLLHDKPNMDDQDREDLDLIIHETTRAADIVRGLLDFARERPPLMEPLDMNDVVHRTVRLIANQQKFEHIDIDEVLQEDLPAVQGDMNQLQQVLLNLSLNACAAMPKGGTLTIRTAVDDDRVIIKVHDTGCGIKEEHLDRIFEPFFTTQEVGKGTGLGLSVTYGLVEQHGGKLEVESKEGEGSTFTIYFPAIL